MLKSSTLRAALVAVALVSASCSPGTSGSTKDTGAEGGVTTLDVGIIPTHDVAVLYLGQEKGFFEERDIKLSFEMAQGGAALVPSVVTGEYDFAFSNAITIMQARDKGLPLTIVSPSVASTGDPERGIDDLMAIDKTIESPRDLEGKTVAVNTLGNLMEVLARVSIEADGGDPSKVDFVELGFPDQVSALSKGDVDAFVCAEPWCTIAEDHGARTIADPYTDMAPKERVVASVYFASEKRVAKDPELFARLQEAISESQAYAREHPDEVREQLPKYTELDEDVISKMGLGYYPSGLAPDELSHLSKAAFHHGAVKQRPKLDELVWSPAE